jgi:phage tail sheath protein FI
MSEVDGPGVSPQEVSQVSHPIQGVPTSNTGFIGRALRGPLNQAVRITSFGEYERQYGGVGAESPMSYAVFHYFDNGGRNAFVVRAAANDTKKKGDAGRIGFREIRRGLKAFDKVDFINLLCVPPFSFQQDVDLQTWAAAIAYCESRRAFLIVDAPSLSERYEDMRDMPRSRNAALFFPRLLQRDPSGINSPVIIPPCGAVAGLFARTDTNRGVWKAPAGLDGRLMGTLGICASPTDSDVDELTRLGINCIRYNPSQGIAVSGARTLDSPDRLASEWKYIPIRRMALYLEESLHQGLKWTVFEPNDEPLWAQVRLNVGAFMQNLFRQGAFQGTSPNEAYFVKCDHETNRPADIDQGILNVLVGFAPSRPMEFVLIKIHVKM